MNKELNLQALESVLSDSELPLIKKMRGYKKRAKISLIILLVFILMQFAWVLLKGPHQFLKSQTHALPLNEGMHGMVNRVSPKIPTWTFKKMSSGIWQKEFEAWFNQYMIAFRSFIIKLHNQIYYQLFSKSYMHSGEIWVGKKNYLFEAPYVKKYYNTSRQVFPQKTAEQWADQIQRLSGFFKQRGQVFLYLVTPSKAAYYPEYLPTCKQCDKVNTRPDYHLMTRVLNERGIPFVDGSKIVINAKKEFGPYLFPKGGTHWSSLAAALVTRQVMRQISQVESLPAFEFSYGYTQNPRGADLDLLSLSNLLSRGKDKTFPAVETLIKPLSKKVSKPLKMVVIGGSFNFELLSTLAATQLFDQIDFFFYWMTGFRYTSLSVKMPATDQGSFYPFERMALKMEDYENILKADIVILEENEQNLISNHSKMFLAYIHLL